MATAPTVCFFARTTDPSVLERVDFYVQDLRILRELGCDVRVATRVRELAPADLYFVWWWTWAVFPVTLARALRRPVVVTGVWDVWAYAPRPALHRAMMRRALRSADANVFVSEMELADVGLALGAARPSYTPLCVDTAALAPAAGPREDFLLTVAGSGMAGGNSARKCIPELIRAMAILRAARPDVRLVIAGRKGEDYPHLARLAEEVGVADAIEFPGVISVADKVSLMQRCRLYLQPTHFEGFGLSILEAMSCGAAVVTNAAGAVPEVGGDAVCYADTPTPESIAAATLALLDEPARIAALQARARARAVERFDIGRRKRELGALIQELLPAAAEFRAAPA